VELVFFGQEQQAWSGVAEAWWGCSIRACLAPLQIPWPLQFKFVQFRGDGHLDPQQYKSLTP